MKFNLMWCFVIILNIIFSSCSSIKNIKYFKDIPDDKLETVLAKVPYIEPKIQPDDILSVSIQTVDPNATQILNAGNLQNAAIGATSAGSTGSQSVSGYLVDNSGNIELPVMGKIKVSGSTTEEAREIIRIKTAEFFKNATVNLRFANFRVSIVGEVAKPATYVISNEKVTILDALALAGDLTIYGKRDNITLIRQDESGERKVVKLDLTNSAVLNSPYYYLRQNDYIYVEPSNSKIASSDAIQNRNISIITAVGASLISVIAILLSTR
ncbi:polysaccharide biosynthesis/export family protein [Mucilaginibacter terrae]|uniref:polysaccharide biosynthesis/export family protein n=1 Tax=Mucilaginibacter terrae TaxID=1955052 RepID=UPI0036300597